MSCVFLFGAIAYSAEKEGLDSEGKTGYILVTDRDRNSLTTPLGHFLVNEQTEIVNDRGVKITIRHIHVPSKVRIRYQTIKDRRVAVKIEARELYPEERAALEKGKGTR